MKIQKGLPPKLVGRVRRSLGWLSRTDRTVASLFGLKRFEVKKVAVCSVRFSSFGL